MQECQSFRISSSAKPLPAQVFNLCLVVRWREFVIRASKAL